MPSFTITAAGQSVTLDPAGAAQAPFTVTNTSPQTLNGRLLPKPRDPAKTEWLSLVGEPVRAFAPNAAEQVVVQLKVPPQTAPGSYSFRLDAVSEVDPDEDFTEGPSVAFDVAPPPPPPKKKFPWWILIVAGAVLLLVVIGLVIWLLARGDDDGAKPALATVPSVTGLQQSAAANVLASVGFGTAVRSVRVSDTASVGIVQNQNPTAGQQAETGTVVTIGVGRLGIFTKPTVTIRTVELRTVP